MDLEDAQTSQDIRVIDYDASVEPAGPQKRWVEDVGSVCRRDEDDACVAFESVHLDQQLVERLLAFVMAAAQSGATMPTDGIDFIDEDDARSVLFPLFKEVPDAGGAYPDEHLDEIGARDRKEGHIGFAGDGLGQQSFSGSRRTHQEHTFGNLPAEALELLRVFEELNDLFEFFLGFVHPCHISEGDLFLVGVEEFGL